ncbi:hypothetical protein L0F63_002206 [Massospora cicadina]|nr:hypothetical protein L0F63_002206 [Massospora cicadina]
MDENIYALLFGPVRPVLEVDLAILLVGVAGLFLKAILLWVTLRRRVRHATAIDSLLIMVVAAADLIACTFVLVSGGLMCGMGSITFCAASATTLIFNAILAGVRYFAFVRGVVIVGNVSDAGLTSEMTVVPSEIYCTLKFWGGTRAFGIISLILLFPPTLLIPLFYAMITLHYSRLVGDANRTRSKMTAIILT